MSGTLSKQLKTRDVVIAGVALVIAASTLITDFSGYFNLGWGFLVALILAAFVNLLLAMSAADLSVSIPRSGGLYEYSRSIFGGHTGAYIGVFIGLSFYMMYGFALSGEMATGAYAAQALFNSDLDVRVFIVLMSLLVIVPNVLGLKETAWFSALLLVLMMGIRWFFGIAGFFGWGDFGEWSADNLMPADGMPSLFGDGGILVAGLALAFWSFVGIEFACSLAEEVEEPHRNMPRGLIIGIGLILLTSVIMGLGVVGTAPLVDWQAMAGTDMACAGSCVQLAVGNTGFGSTGLTLMALSSIAATLGTATIGNVATSRLMYAMGRDGLLFGPTVSKFFGTVNPKTKTPINAIVFTGLVYIIPALFSTQVVELVYTSAYVWILTYIIYHVLSILNRKLHPERQFGMGKNHPMWATVGIFVTVATLYYAFYGAHSIFGVKALIMLGIATLVAALSVAIQDKSTANSPVNITH